MTGSVELRADELIAKRHLQAEPERVWRALTSPASASIVDALAAHLHHDLHHEKATPGRNTP